MEDGEGEKEEGCWLCEERIEGWNLEENCNERESRQDYEREKRWVCFLVSVCVYLAAT